MERYKLANFFRGWFIGNFSPSVLKTSDFEVGILSHKKNETWPRHFHKQGTEYNLLISGLMKIQGETIEPGDIFILRPNEIADPQFLEDCLVLVVKTPSIPGDKFEV